MNELTVTKYNESYIKCTSEDLGLLQELSEFFTFKVPGASFMPSVRAKRWDGQIRLFSKATGKLYYGLLPYVEHFIENRGGTIIREGLEKPTSGSLSDSFSKFVSKILTKSIEIRDYQLSAFSYAINNKRAILLSPTASGKSLIIYCIIRLMTTLEKRSLLIVPTTSLVEQMYKDFEDYGWIPDQHVQRKYYGYEIDESKPVVISTWQSLATFDKKYFEQFDCVVGDEAHLYKSKELQKIMSACVNAKYRIGTTGTLDDSKVHKLVLEGLFGRVHNVTTTRELIDKKQLADLKIQCLILKYSKEECQHVKKLNYQEEMDYIVSHEKRNRFIRNLTKTRTGNTLVLFQYVEKHGKVLYDLIGDTLDHQTRKLFFVYGGTETKDRETVRSITENENNAIIVASYGTFSTGINIRNLHNVIFASPTKSKIRILQSLGRGLRLGNNKVKANLYDIADDFSYKERKNFTLNHFMERINTYSEQEFDYELDHVDIR
jgi:superfamily II DNA or RNA helicase